MKKFLQALMLGAALALLDTGSAHSAPAPWYWWISKHDGRQICAQFMPAKGWERGAGPFDNAQCTSRRRSLLHER
ncbi:hypothetical protein [Comamonas kerstersii]|uniref:hypothetical protein n=1 Tax=Comamonas kerstersii TaxID=225992 RepID=UPI0009857CCD|nr:hypothetical protein [Comamonas kerstersii]OOH84884.1 hypothetical protein BMF38_14295 [Comamonas kerstersii]OOH94553.1 hypothetical protein BMF29_04835 [Comamonas kerstersii]